MSWVILWIALSIAVGVLAHNRGRSGTAWFLLSLIVSPLLGMVFVAVGRDLSKEQNEKADTPRPATHVKCPSCAEWVMPEAKVCKHCRSDLQPVTDFKPISTRTPGAIKAEAQLDMTAKLITGGVVAAVAIGLLVLLR